MISLICFAVVAVAVVGGIYLACEMVAEKRRLVKWYEEQGYRNEVTRRSHG